MTENIRDPNLLKNINPNYVMAYLNSKGWDKQHQISDIASIWIFNEKSENNENYELLVPLKNSIQDFAIRMSEVLVTLSTVENRSQLDIFRDITNLFADIIRIRVKNSEIDNSISLYEGVTLFDSTKQLMYAIASSVVNPKPFFQGGAFKPVRDYMQGLRIGQTEPGSYIIKIISPINEQHTEDVFERQVITNLFHTLNLTTQDNFSEDREPQLIEAVQGGISANFCEALLNMIQGGGIQGINFNLSWSKLIDIPSDVPSEVSINHDVSPKLEKTKRKLKSKEIISFFNDRNNFLERKYLYTLNLPEEELTTSRLTGNVIKLELSGGSEKGQVTIITSIDKKKVEVNVELNLSDYVKAFNANLYRRSVVCEGYLSQSDNQFFLRNTSFFDIF